MRRSIPVGRAQRRNLIELPHVPYGVFSPLGCLRVVQWAQKKAECAGGAEDSHTLYSLHITISFFFFKKRPLGKTIRPELAEHRRNAGYGASVRLSPRCYSF